MFKVLFKAIRDCQLLGFIWSMGVAFIKYNRKRWSLPLLKFYAVEAWQKERKEKKKKKKKFLKIQDCASKFIAIYKK
jgi:hypothetical protein